MTKVHKVEKVTKINSTIISKSHAHLQTMAKTCAKFQKDRYKIVWEVVLTRYPLSIHFHRIWGQEMTKFAKWKKWQKLVQGLYPNHMHIFRPWRKHVQNFKKIGIKLYEELRSQGTHCLKQVAQRATIAHLSPTCQGQSAPKPYAAFPSPQWCYT